MIGNPSVRYHHGEFVSGGNKIARTSNPDTLDIHYLYYVLQGKIDEIDKFYRGPVIRHPVMDKILNIQIPLPPLKIQQEIVDILDKMELLTKEHGLRLKQYKYYRDHLLRYNPNPTRNGLKPYELGDELSGCNNTVIAMLGDCIDLLDNKRQPIAKNQRVAGPYPYYGANGIQDHVDDYIYDGEYALVGEDGSVLNKYNNPIVNWATGKIWVNNHAHVLAQKEGGPLIRYIYFYLQTVNLVELNLVRTGTMTKLTGGNLKKIPVAIPPLEIQRQIIEVLDKFEQYTNEITGLLPKEIELRKKQYKYYRDLLLDFNPLTRKN